MPGRADDSLTKAESTNKAIPREILQATRWHKARRRRGRDLYLHRVER